MTNGKNHTGHYPFTVEPFSEDCRGRLSWGFLGNHLLRCASLHAGSHGFGFDDMIAANHVWVLSRLVVELEAMPRTGEHYAIDTWVSALYRQFTDRLFAITGQGDRVYGYGHSVWALIDMNTRQPMDLAALPGGGFAGAVVERDVPIAGPGRIRVKSPQPVATHTARYSDLDINRHVNSIRYIEMVLDLLPVDLLTSRGVKRLEVAYCAETYAGERLEFFMDTPAEGHYAVEVRKTGGPVVVKAAVTLAAPAGGDHQ